MTSTRSTTGSILDIKGEKMMNTGKGTWTEGQRKMLFSLMEKVDFSKEDMENSLKFPMSELSVQEASILIDCLKNNGDLSEAVGKIKGSHGNAPKGPLDRIPDKTDKTSETPAMPKTREEALQKKQQKETQKIVPAPEQGNTQTVEFSNEKPYLPIDLVDIDRAIALYEKFEYAKRKLAKPEDTALFVGPRGGRLSPRSVQARLKRWGISQGVQQGIHPHLFRHSFASHLLESSGDLRAVQELLGHANISTTQVYTHLDFQHLARIYDQAHPRARKRGGNR